MRKAGLKTFICSFAFSLFMILSINGLFVRPRPLSSDLKIPQKNITLFLKQGLDSAGSARIIPVKKIALRLPPQTSEPAARQDFKIPLDYTTDDDAETVSAAPETTGIPLELAEGSRLSSPPKAVYDGSGNDKEDHLIIKDFDNFIKNRPLIDDKELLVAVNNDPPQKQPTDTASEDAARNETKDIPAIAQLPAEMPVKNKPERAVQTAVADITPSPLSLIPLEYGDKIRSPERQVEIAGRNSTTGQIALAGSEIPISSMNTPAESDKTGKEPPAARQWQTMAEKHNAEDDAWLIAKGAKHPKNTMVLEQEYNQTDEDKTVFTSQSEHNQPADKETQVAELSKNLLIPIPEEIMQEKNLIPRLGSSPHNREIEDRLIEKELRERGIDTAEAAPSETETAPEDKEKKSGGILSGITSLFKSEDKKDNKNVNIIEKPGESYDESGNNGDVYSGDEDTVPFLDKIKDSFRKKFYAGKILPTEIRLAFQPNRAEISGQTLNWLEAFANKTNEDATTGLEIRIDGTSSRLLQQKRLNLLYNILTNKGVEYGKIKIVFTSREPNSFIIRTVKIKNDFDNGGINNTAAAQGGYYMRW